MDKNQNGWGFYILKIFIYILSIFRAVLYAPIVLFVVLFISVLFIVIAPGLLQSGFMKSLLVLSFIPRSGYYNYNIGDMIAIFGKIVFGISLVVAFLEILFKKRLTISVKKRILWFGVLLLVGYGFVFIVLITKFKQGLAGGLTVLPFFIFAMIAVFLDGLIQAFINWLNIASSKLRSINRF